MEIEETKSDELVKDSHGREQMRKQKEKHEEERDSRNLYIFFLNSTELICHRTPDLICQTVSISKREKT